MKKLSKKFTIFVSSNSQKDTIKEFHISAQQIFYGFLALLAVFLLVCVFVLDYAFSFSSRVNGQKLQVENKVLKSRLSKMHVKMEHLNNRLNQMEDFSRKMRVVAGLESASSVPMGPLSSTVFPTMSSSTHSHSGTKDHRGLDSLSTDLTLNNDNLDSDNKKFPLPISSLAEDKVVVYMDRLDQKSRLVQQDINILMEQIFERKDIINSTPSIMPAKGWMSSQFGYREYPFTGEITFHEGMDIAAFPGSPVYAPANGVIMFAGYKSGYGNVIVIDHGYELSTLYGHLSDTMVSKWEKVERGQVIGTIGSTGKSSGPHLHYEVRISNVPVDPSNYILDSL